MSAMKLDTQIGQALVDFSTNGAFPEEEAVSAAYITPSLLPVALGALQDAKIQLESEIRQISSDSASDVDDWIRNAKAIHDDIDKSRKLASSIVRQAEEDEQRLEGLQQQEVYMEFLSKEAHYNTQLLSCLGAIQQANEMLRKVEDQAAEHNVVDALYTLSDTFTAISKIPLERTTRAVRLLDKRASDLRDHIREQLLIMWRASVQVQREDDTATVTVNEQLPNHSTSLSDTVVAFQSFKEVDIIAKKLWDDLDGAVFKRRTDVRGGSPPRVHINGNKLSVGPETTDRTIKTLFADLENIIQFLNQQLPQEFVDPLSRRMMPVLTSRILEDWLDTAVPPSLADMVDYQKAIAQVDEFAAKLDSMKWPGADSLHDWVSNAPKIWLNKRREAALDWTRNQLSLGIGIPQGAERTETRMVARDDGKHLATTATTVNDDWDAAWEGDEPEPSPPSENRSVGNRSSLDERRRVSEVTTPSPIDIDDAAAAWGWGDEEAIAEDEDTPPQPASTQPASSTPQQPRISPETREMTLSEKYWTSSLPQPVFNTVVQIYDDGAQLIKPEYVFPWWHIYLLSEHIPVAPSAPGLFALPTLLLAMYRAISPYYYTSYPGGNMYLYNDAMWLAKKLQDFVVSWKAREDLPPRAYGMVRLDAEIKVLESFGKRAYTNELIAQRTIINDLLSGSQNFFQQDPHTLSDAIIPVVAHIRAQATLFTSILPYSASSSATGSLVNTLASKLISDIFDLSDIGVDEAERIATIISTVESLDDLFLPKNNPDRKGQDQTQLEDAVPLTPQFAPLWLKLKFLSEVLQSNLKDVRYLWFESDLSLYFTAEEVVELIGLSFEMNAQVRSVVREIKERRDPKGLGLGKGAGVGRGEDDGWDT